MSQMDFSPEQDWKKILTPLGAFIKPFLFQNWTLKKKKTEPLTQYNFSSYHFIEWVYGALYQWLLCQC